MKLRKLKNSVKQEKASVRIFKLDFGNLGKINNEKNNKQTITNNIDEKQLKSVANPYDEFEF